MTEQWHSRKVFPDRLHSRCARGELQQADVSALIAASRQPTRYPSFWKSAEPMESRCEPVSQLEVEMGSKVSEMFQGRGLMLRVSECFGAVPQNAALHLPVQGRDSNATWRALKHSFRLVGSETFWESTVSGFEVSRRQQSEIHVVSITRNASSPDFENIPLPDLLPPQRS